MEVKYLEHLFTNSERIYANFKKSAVLKSKTLAEMFTPEYVYRGDKPNIVLVKSLKTNNPAEITVKNCGYSKVYTDNYIYKLYDKYGKEVGFKEFYLCYYISPKGMETSMLTGNMISSANDLYAGVGIREDELQIKTALKNNIDYIPRSSFGSATLYHTLVGFLPVTTEDMMEVKTEADVNRYMEGILRRSPDMHKENLKPVITKDGNVYYIDVNKTQTVANVKEIIQRMAQGYSKKDLNSLRIDGVEMSLHGEELEYWKNLINKVDTYI